MFALASNGLRVSDKTVQKFAELPVRIYCHRQKCRAWPTVSSDMSFTGLFTGVP